NEGMIRLSMNDGVTYTYEKANNGESNNRSKLIMSDMQCKFLSGREAHMKVDQGDWIEVGNLSTGLRLTIKSKVANVREHFEKQVQYLKYQDGNTRRVNMYGELITDGTIPQLDVTTSMITEQQFTVSQEISDTSEDDITETAANDSEQEARLLDMDTDFYYAATQSVGSN